MTKTRSLSVVISGDAKDFSRALGTAGKQSAVLEKDVKRHSLGISKAFLGAAAGAVSLGAGIAQIKKSVGVLEELAKGTMMVSRSTGLDNKEASEWVTLAKVRGVEAKQLNMGFVALARQMKAGASGTDAAVAAFKELGISQAELKRGDASEVIRDVSDAFAKMPDGANKAALAQKLFSRQAGTLLPLLNKGSGELNKQLGVVNKYGAALDKHGVKQAAKAVDAQRELQIAWQGVQITLGKAVIPLMTDGAEKLGTFVKQMRDGTGAGGRFATRLDNIADAVRPIVKFFKDHPQLIAAAVGAWGIYKAAVLTTVVAGKVQAFRKMFTGGGPMARAAGTTTGAAYSTSFATAGSAGVRAASGKGGRLRGAFSTAGRGLGGAMGIAAAGLFGVELAKGVEATLKDTLPGGNKSNPKRPTGTPGPGWNLFDYIKSKVGDGAGRAVERMTSGIGAGGVLPSGGAFGGSLMGARSSLAPFAAIGSRFGLHVSDGKRPGGTRTSSGGISYHSTGEAIDMADGRGPDANKLNFFKTLRSRFGTRLAELIYTPGGAGIKNGKPYTYTGKVAQDHYDHVHVAFDTGRPGIGDGLGRFQATSYGPPWDAMNGTGVTATGVNLRDGQQRYGVAVDPSVIPLGSKLKISPNPFGYGGAFEAFDTGGAIKGKHIDFYDWRGRAKQLAWGSRNVTVSSAGSGGSHGGRSSGGGGSSRPHTTVGTAGPSSGSLGGVGGVTSAQATSDVELAKASAQADDNLPAMIAALSTEKAIKRKRVRKIRRTLKRRVRASTRQRLTEELTQLVTDLAEINALLKEYRADAAGGATTITGADQLTAGVPDGADVATPTDFANAAIAEASLTPGLGDDITATEGLLGIAQGELDAARASGDPRRISAAIDAWKQVKDSLDALKASVDDTGQAMKDHTAALKQVGDEIKRSNDIARAIQSTDNFQLTKYVADLLGGFVVGRGVVGRSFTPGTGVEHAY